MEESEKLNRVVEARMKLKARFEEKIKQTPSVADGRPMGSGQPNRHGMPVVPVGQVITAKWPVLDLGLQPDISLKPDVLLVHTIEGKPLPKEHGGPVRMITPQLYAWKGSKWINRIEFLSRNKLGFWEQRGYSNTAYPWRNDRYSR
jgi:DMSO/TMAO reductase YedYZ molybdopterin-dependent catalytic subunit